MGGVGSGSGGLFGPRFTKGQRELAGRYLAAADWNPKAVNLGRFSAEITRESGVGRDDASLRRLLYRIAKRRKRPTGSAASPSRPAERKQGTGRAYEGPTRFSPAEEQEVVSVAPDCVITEPVIDYDAIIRKLNEKFPERRGKWNRDGIRAVLKRHGDTYDRLLQGERPVPVVVRPPTDSEEHLRLERQLVERRIEALEGEACALRRRWHILDKALEPFVMAKGIAQGNVDVVDRAGMGAAVVEGEVAAPAEEEEVPF